MSSLARAPASAERVNGRVGRRSLPSYESVHVLPDALRGRDRGDADPRRDGARPGRVVRADGTRAPNPGRVSSAPRRAAEGREAALAGRAVVRAGRVPAARRAAPEP